jgi:hypothetical protein
MNNRKRWTDEMLIAAVMGSKSYRSVIKKLGLVPAGGNYVQVKWRVKDLGLDTSHFTGKGWNVDMQDVRTPARPLKELLVNGGRSQSNKLKRRLFQAGILSPKCSKCGWATVAPDGRVPVELDHINGDRNDNRLENLRILCPNCHSLTSTYRGLNKGIARRT